MTSRNKYLYCNYLNKNIYKNRDRQYKEPDPSEQNALIINTIPQKELNLNKEPIIKEPTKEIEKTIIKLKKNSDTNETDFDINKQKVENSIKSNVEPKT